MLATVVIFLVVSCLCKNKALSRIHTHVLGKLEEEFATFKFHIQERPDSSNPNSVKLEAKQVGFMSGREAMDRQDEVEERALLERRR